MKMAAEMSRAKAIFLDAVERKSATERTVFVEQACGGDPELRCRVEALLRAHDGTEGVLDRPAAEQFPPESVCFNAPGDATTEALDMPAPGKRDDALSFLEQSSQPGSIGRLGHYEILEVLGQGAFGIVFKSFDKKLHRIVAIKVLSPVLSANGTARQRFLREARAAAAVRDVHVIGIHAVEESPLPFLVMEYVQGQTLQEKLNKTGPLPVTEILRIGYQIAAGLSAAHKQGLIHRDIKPSNILLENGVERVKLSDFGLARTVDDASLTQSGLVAGTPMYMSPEQAEAHHIDHRSDLFSLGSVLFALCTGRPPFRADSTPAVLKRVCEDVPRPIREVNREIPEWLSDAVGRLLAKKPEDRFQSADEVAELLARWLAELQVHGQVKPLTQPVPAAPVAARKPAWKTVGLVAVPILAGVLVVFLAIRGHWLGSRGRENSEGSESRSSAVQLPNPLDQRTRAQVPEQLLALAGGGDAERAPAELVAVLAGGRFEVPPKSFVGWPAYSNNGKLIAVPIRNQVYLFHATSGVLLQKFTAPTERISRAAFDQRGKRLIAACNTVINQDHREFFVQLWDLESGNALEKLAGPKTWITALAYSPDRKYIVASAYDDANVYVWDAESLKAMDPLSFNGMKMETLTFDKTGKFVAGQGKEGGAVWDMDGHGELHSWKNGTASEPFGCAFSADGNWLAASANDGVKVWKTNNFQEERSFPALDRRWLALSPDGKMLFTARHDVRGGAAPAIRRWDVASGKELSTITPDTHGDYLFCELSPDGKVLLAVGDNDAQLRRFDAKSGEMLPRSEGHSGGVEAVAVSPDGQWLATGGDDWTVRLWDLAGWRSGDEMPPVQVLTGHTAAVWSVKFSPDGKLLASGSLDGTIGLWDLTSRKRVHTLKGHSRTYSRIGFSPNGKTIAGGQQDGTVKLWDVETGQVRSEIPGHTGEVRCVAYSPDGKLLATSGVDKNIQVFDTATEQLVHNFSLPQTVDRVAFTPDGRLLGATTDNADPSVLSLWTVENWQQRVVPGHPANVPGLAFSSSGNTAATSGGDGVVRFWNIQAEIPHPLVFGPGPFGNWAADVAFTPDGRYLATANNNGSVTILRVPELASAYQPTAPPSLPKPAELANRESPADALDSQKIPNALLVGADGKTPDSLVAILGGKDGHTGQVFGIAVSPDGKTLASAGVDKSVRLWDLASGTMRRSISLDKACAYCVAFSSDNRFLAYGTESGDIVFRDSDGNKELRRLTGHNVRVTSLTFSPDSRLLISTSDDGTVRLWDVENGKQKRLLVNGASITWSASFSPDGKTVASGFADGVVRLWDVETGWEVAALKSHLPVWIRAIAFNPDGQTLVSTSHKIDEPARLWDLHKLEPRELLNGHTSAVISACWDGAGRLLATAGDIDGTIRIWDISTNPVRCKVLKVLPQGKPWLQAVVFTPDGRHLATANPNGTIYILRLAERGKVAEVGN